MPKEGSSQDNPPVLDISKTIDNKEVQNPVAHLAQFLKDNNYKLSIEPVQVENLEGGTGVIVRMGKIVIDNG